MRNRLRRILPLPEAMIKLNRAIVVPAVFLLGLILPISTPAAQAPADRDTRMALAANAGPYKNSWAVVIGINGYQKAPRLNYAVSDAKSILAALEGLGFPRDKTIVMMDREATKQRIEQVLYGILRKSTEEDRVFVFFAGHGITFSLPRGGEEGYLLPVDADPDDPALTAIAMEDLRRIARRIPAKHVLFAVDACYSGFAITRDIPPTRVDAIYLEAMIKEPAVQIITAGRRGEPVLEEDGHGLFTRRLIQGLTGLADVDQNGVITGQELATWLESRVIRDSLNRQHPQYSRLDGEGQFVFLVPRTEESLAASPDATDRLKNLADEVERLRREKASWEEERKLQSEREALLVEKATLESARKETTKIPRNRILSIALLTEKREIEINEVVSLRARVVYADGRATEISQGVEWITGDSKIATVDSLGKLRAQRAGRTEIAARYSGITSPALVFAVSDPKPQPAMSSSLNEHIGIARSYREQGNYDAALRELEGIRALHATNKDLILEIELTRKACRAEKQLGTADLMC
jgi:uncharacterized caspase-like protein